MQRKIFLYPLRKILTQSPSHLLKTAENTNQQKVKKSFCINTKVNDKNSFKNHIFSQLPALSYALIPLSHTEYAIIKLMIDTHIVPPAAINIFSLLIKYDAGKYAVNANGTIKVIIPTIIWGYILIGYFAKSLME